MESLQRFQFSSFLIERQNHFTESVRIRDKKGNNSHVYIPWNKLVSEPSELSLPLYKCSCYFNLCSCNIRSGSSVASYLYARSSRRCYKVLTNIIIIFIATICGLVLGCHAFVHIWMLTPCRKVIYVKEN